MRKWIPVVVVLAVGAAAYAAWPLVGMVQLARAVHARDAADTLARVDVVAVRRSIFNQILDEGTRGTELDRQLGRFGRSIAVGLAQSTLDRQFADMVDDDALRALLADGRFPPDFEAAMRREAPSIDGGMASFPRIPENPFRYIHGWRFRSPITVEATIGEDDRPDTWTMLRLRRSGLTWKLTGIGLPDAVLDRIKPVVREKLREVGLD